MYKKNFMICSFHQIVIRVLKASRTRHAGYVPRWKFRPGWENNITVNFNKVYCKDVHMVHLGQDSG